MDPSPDSEEFRNAPTPEPEEVQEETFTTEQILKGEPKIPLKNVFEFALEYVASQYEKKMGFATPVDRNFLFFQEHSSRKQMEKVKRYTFLFPMIADPESRNALIAIQPYSELRDTTLKTFERECYLIHYLVPKEDDKETGVIALNTYFQNEIRDRAMENGGLTLAHILASLLVSIDERYPHFGIQSGDNTDDDPKKTRWSFHVVPTQEETKLFIYRIPYAPPVDGVHEAVLSPWISHTLPTFQRETKAAKCFSFSKEDIASLREDEDVKPLLLDAKEELPSK